MTLLLIFYLIITYEAVRHRLTITRCSMFDLTHSAVVLDSVYEMRAHGEVPTRSNKSYSME